MALSRFRLGDLICQRREKYNEKETLPIKGVSREGFIPPKQDDADISKYNVFYRNDFVFNPARMELNSIALNTFFDKAICSSLYEVFYVTDEHILLPEYLNLYVKRDEFARKCWFEAIGSARNYFRVSDLSEFQIDLPDVSVQQKYVDIYKSMVANQQSYERGLEDLKLVCDGYIEDLRRRTPCEKIGPYICESSLKNNGRLSLDSVRGLSTSKELILTKADMTDVSLDNYKVLKPGQIAYVPDTTRRGNKISLGFNNTQEDFLVSSICVVFGTKRDYLLPDYLMLFLTKPEFDRYTRFYSWGSVRESFDWDEMCNICIPIPEIRVQRAIVGIYAVYTMRKNINEQLKAQSKKVSPILIKGSLEEAK